MIELAPFAGVAFLLAIVYVVFRLTRAPYNCKGWHEFTTANLDDNNGIYVRIHAKCKRCGFVKVRQARYLTEPAEPRGCPAPVRVWDYPIQSPHVEKGETVMGHGEGMVSPEEFKRQYLDNPVVSHALDKVARKHFIRP